MVVNVCSNTSVGNLIILRYIFENKHLSVSANIIKDPFNILFLANIAKLFKYFYKVMCVSFELKYNINMIQRLKRRNIILPFICILVISSPE